MSYFVYKTDKPRKYKGYTIRPDKREGNWSAYASGVQTIYGSTLASIKRVLKRRRRR